MNKYVHMNMKNKCIYIYICICIYIYRICILVGCGIWPEICGSLGPYGWQRTRGLTNYFSWRLQCTWTSKVANIMAHAPFIQLGIKATVLGTLVVQVVRFCACYGFVPRASQIVSYKGLCSTLQVGCGCTSRVPGLRFLTEGSGIADC